MIIEFTVVVYASPNTRVAVVGDIGPLGSWNVAESVPMMPVERPSAEQSPTFFVGSVDLPEWQVVEQKQFANNKECNLRICSAAPSEKFSYKFIRWETEPCKPLDNHDANVYALPSPSAGTHLTSNGFLYKESDLLIPEPPAELIRSYRQRPATHHQVVWEGDGPHHDRVVFVHMDGVVSLAARDRARIHVLSSQNLVRCSAAESSRLYYALPSVDFMEPAGSHNALTEVEHTTRYYFQIRDLKLIHFNRIIPRLYCGSCPRQLSHLDILRDDYAIGAVFNLQTSDDIRRNWINDEICSEPSRVVERLHELYMERSIRFNHIPTEDMSTHARGAMMAQAAWLLAGYLVANPDSNVYVHCNAGVGRAVACCCAFLHLCLGLPAAETLQLVRRRRPVAFLDPTALTVGKQDFKNKFARAALCLPLVEKKPKNV